MTFARVLLSLCVVFVTSADRVLERLECLDLDELKKIPVVGNLFKEDICLGYTLDTCDNDVEHEEMNAKVNVTMGRQVLVKQNLADLMKEPTCVDNKDFPDFIPIGKSIPDCQTCFGVKPGGVTIKPSWARICPQVTEICKGIEFELPAVECQEFGTDCETLGQASCSDCAKIEGCGYCPEKKTCVSAIRDVPYCSDGCTEGPFYFETKQCEEAFEAAQKAAEEEEQRRNGKQRKGTIVGVVVTAVVLVLCAGTFFFCRNRKARNERPTHGGFSAPMEIDDDVDGGYNDVPGVAVHTDI